MKKSAVVPESLRGVFPVPPLARKRDAARSIDFDESSRVVSHIHRGGCTRLLYGGNAFLYHITLAEYEQLIGWLAGQDDELWMIPSAGPSYGRLLDQAPVLRRYSFPCVMALPSGDPRDAAGLERGLREFAQAAATPLMLYIKEESNFGADKDAGLDAVARMVADGTCIAIKYAVVRSNPAEDTYLANLLRRVPRDVVISGIGERPAIVHMRDWGLRGFTTGSGCVAPNLTQEIFELCSRGEYDAAVPVREKFLPLEDMRDAWGPARVLHAATELAGISSTGAIAPFVSELDAGSIERLRPVARELAAAAEKALSVTTSLGA
jgi:dihydrodipicolinate synthase/N-acetylneuraminate lyase